MSKSKPAIIRRINRVSREDVLRLARNIQQDDAQRPSKAKIEKAWDPDQDWNMDIRLYGEHTEAVLDASAALEVSPLAGVRGLIATYLVGLDLPFRGPIGRDS